MVSTQNKNMSYTKVKRRKKIFRLRKPIVLGIALLLIGGGVFAYTQFKKDDSNKQADNPTTTQEEPISVVANPPTEQDKKSLEDFKNQLGDQQTSEKAPTQSSSSAKQVTVAIVNASRANNTVTVSGYVTGVVEDGGTCTLTITKGSDKRTATASGFANSSTTNCPPIEIPNISTAGWNAILSYQSSKASGSSGAQPIN